MSNIKELFITYESAYRLRELGFDEPCFAYYDYYNGGGHLCEPKIYTNWFQKLMSKIFKKIQNISIKFILIILQMIVVVLHLLINNHLIG